MTSLIVIKGEKHFEIPSGISAETLQAIRSEIYRLLETGASFEEAKAALAPLVDLAAKDLRA